MPQSISQIVADAWVEVVERSRQDTPVVQWNDWFGPRQSYRDAITKPKRNMFGKVIPRIVIVRNNLRRLGKPNRAPLLPD
jgi:hypothetical protein